MTRAATSARSDALRVHLPLFVASGVLCVVYAGLFVLALRYRDAHQITLAESPSGDAAYYKVSLPSGEVHVHYVDGSDPAAILTQAGQWGQGARVQRISVEEARALASGTPSSPYWLLLLFVFPAALAWAGVHARKRQQLSAAVLELLRSTLSMSASEVLDASGATRGELQRIVAGIRRRRLLALNWDAKTDRIFDTRLSLYSITLPFCPRCNSHVNLHVKADLNVLPACPDCVGPSERTQLMALTREIVERLQHEPVQGVALEPVFSVGRFALWTLLFPPGAALYALSRLD